MIDCEECGCPVNIYNNAIDSEQITGQEWTAIDRFIYVTSETVSRVSNSSRIVTSFAVLTILAVITLVL